MTKRGAQRARGRAKAARRRWLAQHEATLRAAREGVRAWLDGEGREMVERVSARLRASIGASLGARLAVLSGSTEVSDG